jgi:hypothetical protein
MSSASPRIGGPASQASLSRILGLGFGIAVIFGGTVGVGILRLPGTIAGELQSVPLILPSGAMDCLPKAWRALVRAARRGRRNSASCSFFSA